MTFVFNGSDLIPGAGRQSLRWKEFWLRQNMWPPAFVHFAAITNLR